MASSSFPLPIFTSVNDVEELESFSIPKLVTYLKTSSRTECFKTVENILISREEKLKFEKEEVMKVVEGLEKELRAYEDSCLKWSMGVGKLESEKSEIESDFKEEVQRHEEDFNVYCERERRAIERIRNLSSELQNVTREKNKEIIELKTKNKEVECKKRKLEDERDMLKRRLVGMEKRVTNLENECAKLTLQFEAIEDSEEEETYGEENRGDYVRRSLAERSGSGQAGAEGSATWEEEQSSVTGP